jgi:CBS domain containing-hemolysin-like protein
LPEIVRPGAIRTLFVFRPFLTLIARIDARVKVRGGEQQALAERNGPGQRDMLFGLFSLADTTVAEVMTPRLDIVAVDASAEEEEVVTAFRSSEHSRLLVYDGQSDAIAGVLYAKDMLVSPPPGTEAEDWHTLIRPAAFVPEAKTLNRQLHDFQRGPSHLAVVVDEFGGTAGLVTLEDILEQVVGEIQDEHDTDETQPVIQDAEGRLSVEGGVALSELESLLGHHFHREDVSTVGGLVLDAFGRVPRSGERIDVDGVELTVEQVARRRVRRVLVTRPARAEAPAEDTTA